MDITRYEPFRDMQVLRTRIDKLFEDTFGRLPGDGFGLFRDTPALNMYETDTAINVDVPLPGIKPDEVEVTITGNTLTIKGEHKANEEVKDDKYYRREVRYDTFARTVELPPIADVGNAEATFESGMLTIAFPKTATTEPKKLEIKQPEEQPVA